MRPIELSPVLDRIVPTFCGSLSRAAGNRGCNSVKDAKNRVEALMRHSFNLGSDLLQLTMDPDLTPSDTFTRRHTTAKTKHSPALVGNEDIILGNLVCLKLFLL
uniref:Uncharacterized protein n=1 Tax=Cacopsylla melanoneura TaxID=428564 RepID=A0A8D8SNX6_9HEMI